MATFKHISSKNADYGAAEQYLTFEHDEFTMNPTLDKNGRLLPRLCGFAAFLVFIFYGVVSRLFYYFLSVVSLKVIFTAF